VVQLLEGFENGIGSKPLANFAAARFARLYPLYICVLVLGSITTSWDSLAAAFPRALLFLPLVQAWFSTNGSSVLILSVWDLAHSWSISVEFFLYILFPALGLLTWRMNSRTGLLTLSVLNMLMLAVLVMICTTRTESIAHRIGPELSQDQAMMWLLYYSPVTHVFEFVQGCYACALVTRFGKAALPFRSVFAAGLFLLVSGTFITGWSGIVPQQPSLAAFRYVAVATAFFLLLYVVAAEENFCLTRLLSTRVLVAGGEISYSVYLLHPFILKWFVKPVQPMITFVGVIEWLYVIVSALACIFVLSYGSYALIEVPARRWLRNRLTGSRIHHERAGRRSHCRFQ
jgi:peptidoglycan/LPS O-acetylase OafA/YrhL